MNNIVVIGAGLSGRGYLNRLLYLSQKKVTFMDKDATLIQQLQEKKQYKITFEKERETLCIDNFTAYTLADSACLKILTNADVIFICVGATHVKELLELLRESMIQRGNREVDIIVAENGVQTSKPLQDLKQDQRVHLSEAVIFCTTLGKANTLDIFSENLDHLPYDTLALGHPLPFYGFVEEKQFPILLERKIYTYNCISACIAYLGYVKGYKDYAKAANDPFINEKIHHIAESLNSSIASEYRIPLEEQQQFSQMAIKKFQNKNIVDTVERNVRDVERKLAESERILAPLKIIEKHNGYCEDLLEVCASAILYGIDTNTLLCTKDVVNGYFSCLPSEWKMCISLKIKELQQ